MSGVLASAGSENARKSIGRRVFVLAIVVVVIELTGFAGLVLEGNGPASRPLTWAGPILMIIGLALYAVGAILARRHDKLLTNEIRHSPPDDLSSRE